MQRGTLTNQVSALVRDDSFTAKLLKSELFDIFYPEDGLREIEFYKSYILSKREKSQQRWSFDYALSFILDAVNIPSELYSSRIAEAYKIMKEIDEKDVPFLALALALNSPIWSNDKHFSQQKIVRVYKTNEIMELMRDRV